MPLTHGYNTLTTGLVYNYNDQQAILSLRKYLKLLLWTIYFSVHQQNMYIQKRQKWKQQKDNSRCK